MHFTDFKRDLYLYSNIYSYLYSYSFNIRIHIYIRESFVSIFVYEKLIDADIM